MFTLRIRIKRNFSLLFISLLFFLPVRAQTSSDQQTLLAEYLDSLSEYASPEIAYIQTSKDIYESGEDLWFKVYMLNAKYLIPSELSRTLYLQIISERDRKVLWQEKYEVENGFATGRVYLSTSIPEGDYLLAAYTPNSFINDTVDFKAVRKISIRKDITSPRIITAKTDKTFYNNEDSIKVTLSSLLNQSDSSNTEINTVLKQDNKKLEKIKTTLSPKGQIVITFHPVAIKEGLHVEIDAEHGDRTESLTIPVLEKSGAVHFTTLPEGGDLVTGIRSRLAFKAVNSEGNPVEIRGTLFEDGSPLIEFKSLHAGMGSFEFVPDSGKKYLIRLSEPVVDCDYLLPEISGEGMTLKMAGRDKDFLYFKVTQTNTLDSRKIYLLVQVRGVVYGTSEGQLDRELLIKVPTAGLPQGIAEITLFNNNLIPVAERLVYVNPERKLNVTAQLSKEILPTRGKAAIKIKVRDEKGKAVRANLGVSVFDRLYQNSNDESNILTHYYLSSELKGRIYDPSSYFDPKNKDRYEALDLLMLTQGWRRYIWNEMSLKRFERNHDQVLSDGINGEIFYSDRKRKIPKEQTFILAFSPNRDSTKILIPADSAGEFLVTPEMLKKWQEDYVYLKPFGPHRNQIDPKITDPLAPPEFRLQIKLEDPFETINRIMQTNELTYPLPQVMKDEDKMSSDQFKVDAGVVRIKEVTIKGRRAGIIRGKYLGLLDSIATHTDDYVCPFCVLNCPRHLPGDIVTVIPFPGMCYEKKPIPGKTYFVIYLYNTPAEYTRTVTYYYPKYSEEELLKRNNLSRVKAYYGNREFYKPDYDHNPGDIHIPDYRNTLLWEPSVITDEKGEATLSFYCSDINTFFIGRIEGVGGEGLLGTGSFNFSVRRTEAVH